MNYHQWLAWARRTAACVTPPKGYTAKQWAKIRAAAAKAVRESQTRGK